MAPKNQSELIQNIVREGLCDEREKDYVLQCIVVGTVLNATL
jgi:hypothetical protein